MKPENWRIAIILTSEGFGGIQLLNENPKIQHLMEIMPYLREPIEHLDSICRTIGEGSDSEANHYH